MLVLVTGGTGFLGKAIIKQLLAQNHRVISVARGISNELYALGVAQVQCDISIKESLSTVFTGVDAVIHTAAKAGVWGDYKQYYATNVIGTKNIIDACLAEQVKYLIHTSSPSVVFNGQDQEGIDEAAPYPDSFLSHYSDTKARAEQLLQLCKPLGLKTTILRPHLIWGPGDNHLIPRVIKMGLSGSLRLIGSGDKWVDAVYIDNAAMAHVDALNSLADVTRCQKVDGKVFFITNCEPMPMKKILKSILVAAGITYELKSVNPKIAFKFAGLLEWLHSIFAKNKEPKLTRFTVKQLSTAHWYDNSAALIDLGYNPTISMEEGFKRLAASLGNSWDDPKNQLQP